MRLFYLTKVGGETSPSNCCETVRTNNNTNNNNSFNHNYIIQSQLSFPPSAFEQTPTQLEVGDAVEIRHPELNKSKPSYLLQLQLYSSPNDNPTSHKNNANLLDITPRVIAYSSLLMDDSNRNKKPTSLITRNELALYLLQVISE